MTRPRHRNTALGKVLSGIISHRMDFKYEGPPAALWPIVSVRGESYGGVTLAPYLSALTPVPGGRGGTRHRGGGGTSQGGGYPPQGDTGTRTDMRHGVSARHGYDSRRRRLEQILIRRPTLQVRYSGARWAAAHRDAAETGKV